MVKKIAYSAYIFWIFLYVLVVIHPELHYHIQQPAFFYGSSFFMQFTMHPADMGGYFANYIMQGFNSNLSGTIIILLFATSMAAIFILFSKKLNLVLWPLFAAIIIIYTICVFNDYTVPFEIVLSSFTIFCTALIFLLFIKDGIRAIVYNILTYCILYYIFGSGAAFIYGLTALVVVILTLPLRSILKQALILIIAGVILPFIAFKFVFNIPLTMAYFGFMPFAPITQKYDESWFLYSFEFLLPALLIVSYSISILYNKKLNIAITSWKEKSKALTVALEVFTICVMVALSIILIFLTSNDHKRNIAKADFYSYNGNWDKVIDIALNDKQYDFSLNVNYNRAIDYKGAFLQKFFDYPQQLGVSSIYPDNLKTPVYSLLACDFYFDLNYVSKSQHWAYAALTIEPYNARIMKRLVETNAILGNYQAAGIYLNALEQHPNCGEFVSRYRAFLNDTSKIAADEFLSKKRLLKPDNFAIPVNISDRLNDLITKDSTNIQAYEHLQMSYLLNHDLGSFMRNFNASVKFYNRIPDLYELAYVIYLYSNPGFDFGNISVSPATKKLFMQYLNIMQKYKGDKAAAQSELKSMANTYLYYISYVSPKVTNITVETKIE